jgi:hypothetical protein
MALLKLQTQLMLESFALIRCSCELLWMKTWSWTLTHLVSSVGDTVLWRQRIGWWWWHGRVVAMGWCARTHM